MTSRHLVDPELLGLLELWPAVTVDSQTLPLLRDPNRLPLREIENPERVEKRQFSAPGPTGAPDVPLIAYRPANSDGILLPCIYHIHGGGYIAGAAASMEPIHRMIVEQLQCALVTVDYRLAPETPFPGPLEDCYAGLGWVIAQAATLRIDAGRIGVSGESAGGGLAAGLALLARDRGEYALAFQHLIYPMLDDRTCTTTDPHPHAGEFIWTAPSNAFGWQSYLGMVPGCDNVSPYAATARAEDLRNLPPTFMAAGSLDLFIDEDMTYARRLIRAGVPTELHIYPGGYHAFDLDPVADVASRMRRDSLDFLKRHLRAGSR